MVYYLYGDIVKNNTRTQIIALFLIAIFFASLFVLSVASSNQSQSRRIYSLNLVISTVPADNKSVGNQYIFFQSENGSLVSSAVITVPAATEIKITIINYDGDIDAPMVQSAINVSGVVGNDIRVFNSVSVPQASLSSGSGSAIYNYVPASRLSHTFSTSTGVNIPILPHSTEIAYTYFQNTGTYSWGCLCQCGQFSMDSPGWMTGQINVVLP